MIVSVREQKIDGGTVLQLETTVVATGYFGRQVIDDELVNIDEREASLRKMAYQIGAKYARDIIAELEKQNELKAAP